MYVRTRIEREIQRKCENVKQEQYTQLVALVHYIDEAEQ